MPTTLPSLLDRCCERCRHGAPDPCQDWLACRLTGPFCHDDPTCHAGKLEVVRRTAYGPGVLVGVPQGDCGRGRGSGELLEALAGLLPTERAEVVATGCLGYCSAEPLVWVSRPGAPVELYGRVEPERAGELAGAILAGEGRPGHRVALLPPSIADERSFRDNRHLYSLEESDGFHPFLERQMRLVTAHCGLARPLEIDDYLMRGGLHPLFMLRRYLSREEALAFLEDSGLESRHDGQPVAPGWREFSASPGGLLRLDLRDAAANPPALSRRLLEGVPFQVLESLLLLAELTGAARAEIVLPEDWTPLTDTLPGTLRERYAARGQQPDQHLTRALELLRRSGALLADGPELTLTTAPDSAEALPLELETLLNLPPIIEMGGEWFRGFGHGSHPGTKCFLVGGPLAAEGFCELNLGTTLGEVIEQACGGGNPAPVVRVLAPPETYTPADFPRPLDFPALGDGPSPLPPPACLAAQVETAEEPLRRETAPEVRPAVSPWAALLASQRRLSPPPGTAPAVTAAWRLVGQRLALIAALGPRSAELAYLGRWLRFLGETAPVPLARWAAQALFSLYAQAHSPERTGSELLGQ